MDILPIFCAGQHANQVQCVFANWRAKLRPIRAESEFLSPAHLHYNRSAISSLMCSLNHWASSGHVYKIYIFTTSADYCVEPCACMQRKYTANYTKTHGQCSDRNKLENYMEIIRNRVRTADESANGCATLLLHSNL